jgi:hypothetical protein
MVTAPDILVFLALNALGGAEQFSPWRSIGAYGELIHELALS